MPGVYIGTSKLKCAYVGTTAVKCIYVGTTKVRPTSPTIDYLIAGGGGGAGNTRSSRQGGGGGGGGQVKYCCGYEINTGSYTVTVGSGGATKCRGGTSTFNGVSAVGGYGGTDGYCSSGTYPYHSGCGGASGSGCAGGACVGSKCSNYCLTGGGGGGQSGAGCAGASRQNCSNGGAGLSLNFTGATVEYGKGGQSGPYSNQTTICSQGGSGCRDANCQQGGGGIVIIKYPSSCGYSITGGTKTSATISGVCYCVHIFCSSGTLCVS